jgi:hypothetical protein
MSIESLDLNQAVSYIGGDGDEDSWSKFDDYHRAALQRLESSGADFALMASNTPHHRFASIVRGPHDREIRAATAGLIAELRLGKIECSAERLGRIVKTAFRPRVPIATYSVLGVHGTTVRLPGAEDAANL